MKRIVSLIISFAIIFVWLPSIIAISATSQELSVDFSKYSVGKTFKQYCDKDGNYVTDGYTFKKVGDGLEYKRNKNEVFYNPSKQVKTTLRAYKTFPFSEDGSGNGYRLKPNTVYRIVLNYNLKTISDNGKITLEGRASLYGGSADVANNTTSKALVMYSDSKMKEKAVINKLGSNSITAYFKCDDFNTNKSDIYDTLFLILNSTDSSDVELVINSMSIKPMSAIELNYQDGSSECFIDEPGAEFGFPSENNETYYYGTIGEYSIKSVKLYNDKNFSDAAENVKFPDDDIKTLYGRSEIESCGTVNQVAFCGFDTYSLRESSVAGNKDFALISGALSKSSSISDETAYSGVKSLKVVSDGNTSQDYTCNYIGNGFEMEEGTTYQLKLRYKAADTNNAGGVLLKFGCGANRYHVPDIIGNSANEYKISKEELNSDTKWHEATMSFTADINNRKNLKNNYQDDGYKLLAPILSVVPDKDCAVSLYIDSIAISKVVTTEDCETVKQGNKESGINFSFSYNSDEDGKIFLAGKSETVKEYGIIVGNKENVKSYELNLSNGENVTVYKSDALNDSYDSALGKRTFSVTVNSDDLNRKVSARSYVKLSDGNVYYSSVNAQSINTIGNKENWDDVYYKVKKPSSGKAYGSFEVYTKSSVSNNYYINYHFVYTEKDAAPELEFGGGGDNGANQKTYRIIGADLVKKTGSNFEKIQQLLQNGEIEFAFSEDGAGDFVGGFHGDEIMEFAELTADGRTVDLSKECDLQTCKQLVFETKTKMFRCNSDTTETPSQQVNNHTLKYTITSKDGICLEQALQWKVSDLKIKKAMACMFTIYRCTDKNERITDVLEYHKWNGDIYDVIDVSNDGPKENYNEYCSYSGPSYVNIYGKDSGIFAQVGYKAVKGIKDELCNHCWIRPYGDNKPYFSVNEGTTVKENEEWQWINYYKIDYTKKDAEIASYTVKINPGENMTLVSGSETQKVTGDITPVRYKANDGYRFAEDYSVSGKNGIGVRRISDTEIEVFGTPNANTEITLTAPEKIPTYYTVKINSGANMTLVSGSETQKVTGDITPVKYKANDGYYFPEDYSINENTGLSVKRINETEITVYGRVIADTTLNLNDAAKSAIFVPEIIEGTNGVWSSGSKDGIMFRSNADFSDFICVKVDGIEIDRTLYTAKSGSTVIELSTAFLKTLSVGKHTITISSVTGNATTEFTIQDVADKGQNDKENINSNTDDKESNIANNEETSINNKENSVNNENDSAENVSPKTGEQIKNVILITTILLISLATAILLFIYLKKVCR